MKRETAYEVELRRKIQQTPPDKHPCSKCGSEMKHAIGKEGTIAEGIEEWYCRKCGHCEEKVKP